MKKEVLIIGGVGAASTIAMAIIDANNRGYNEYVFKGYINDKDGLEAINGYPVVGGINNIPELLSKGYYIINTVCKIDGQVFRVKLFEDLNIPKEKLATFIHPLAFVAPDVNIGSGCVIMPNATVSSGVVFGVNCRVMSGALIGHDTIIGDHGFFAAHSTIGSHIKIGKASYFGLNCTVGGKLKVGEFSVVGMGSVVTKSINSYEIWAGNPARFMRYVNDKPD